jgi:hypothetical protein
LEEKYTGPGIQREGRSHGLRILSSNKIVGTLNESGGKGIRKESEENGKGG